MHKDSEVFKVNSLFSGKSLSISVNITEKNPAAIILFVLIREDHVEQEVEASHEKIRVKPMCWELFLEMFM